MGLFVLRDPDAVDNLSVGGCLSDRQYYIFAKTAVDAAAAGHDTECIFDSIEVGDFGASRIVRARQQFILCLWQAWRQFHAEPPPHFQRR
jgi:hypothetical protein